ncbi:MAG TPA: hypothetical protein VH000_10410 [Rhizomicrobium sp.]|nr:hypothetical protein [Rhizomicrobium sp.]
MEESVISNSKIPVGQSIRYAYTFTFGHLGAIIGLIWVPMLIVSIGSFFSFSYYTSSLSAALAQGTPETAGQAAGLMLGWTVVGLGLTSMMYASVAELALGLRKGSPLYHFAFGANEMRVFGGLAALMGVMILFVLGYLLAVGLVSAAGTAAGGGNPVVALIVAVLALAGYLAIIYAMVRLSFLLIPATVAENAVSLARSWKLTQGNFWRIFAIGICTLLPLILVMLVAEAAIFGPDFYTMPPDSGAAPDMAQEMKLIGQQMSMMNAHLPALMGLSFVLSPLWAGLLVAPAAYAYRALVPARGQV